MARKREPWTPKIINRMADGSIVDDLTGYKIPEGHAFYDIMAGIVREKLAEQEQRA